MARINIVSMPQNVFQSAILLCINVLCHRFRGAWPNYKGFWCEFWNNGFTIFFQLRCLLAGCACMWTLSRTFVNPGSQRREVSVSAEAGYFPVGNAKQTAPYGERDPLPAGYGIRTGLSDLLKPLNAEAGVVAKEDSIPTILVMLTGIVLLFLFYLLLLLIDNQSVLLPPEDEFDEYVANFLPYFFFGEKWAVLYWQNVHCGIATLFSLCKPVVPNLWKQIESPNFWTKKRIAHRTVSQAWCHKMSRDVTAVSLRVLIWTKFVVFIFHAWNSMAWWLWLDSVVFIQIFLSRSWPCPQICWDICQFVQPWWIQPPHSNHSNHLRTKPNILFILCKDHTLLVVEYIYIYIYTDALCLTVNSHPCCFQLMSCCLFFQCCSVMRLSVRVTCALWVANSTQDLRTIIYLQVQMCFIWMKNCFKMLPCRCEQVDCNTSNTNMHRLHRTPCLFFLRLELSTGSVTANTSGTKL